MERQKLQSWLRIGVVLMVAVVLVGAGAVLAQLPIPATEPGGEVTESRPSFDSYLDAGIVIPENGLDASGEPFVQAVSLRIRIPEVIVLRFCDQYLRPRVVFSRRNLFRRDRNTCQYCGEKFPTEKHFSAWLGLAPKHDISGGKVLNNKTLKTKNRAGQAFRMAAQSVKKADCPFGVMYRRLRARLGFSG